MRAMSKTKEPGPLGALIREIVNSSEPDDSALTLGSAERYFFFFSRLDYAASLRKHFDGRQIEELVAEF